MMLFDPKAALQKIEKQPGTPATSATLATFHPQTPPKVAEIAEVAAPGAEKPKNRPEDQKLPNDDFKHGVALNGHPKTWTGKIVSLEEWRQLSAWEKHGPDGKLWNGKTQAWEVPKA